MINDMINKPANEYVYDVLYRKIRKIKLVPGSLIKPNEVAKELQVSRTPVQMACSVLASEGLLTVYPQRGSYVSLIDLRRVYESIYLRNLLEQSLVQRIALSSDRKIVLAKLYSNVNEQKEAVAKENYPELLELDIKFHDILYDELSFPNIKKSLNAITLDQDRIRYLKINTQIRVKETIDEHEALLNAMSQGNSKRAAFLCYQHLSKFGEDICNMKALYPDYFMNDESDIESEIPYQKFDLYDFRL